MNTLATLLIIMWVIVLIGICFIVKRLNIIEEKMIEIHNHLVDGIDHVIDGVDTCYKDTVNNLGDFREALDNLNDMLQSAQDSRNAIHMKLDNLQENWSDLKTGSIQVLTVK